MRKILLVEDEPDLRETYTFILSTEPYDVHAAANGKEALELCREYEFELILLDLMMPVMDGIQFLKNFHPDIHPTTRVIIISNLSAGDILTNALQLGAQRSVIKADLTPKQLLTLVRYEVEAV